MNTKIKKSEETKIRIIRSAGMLFQKKGFEATSVREIVEDAGCAKGTFYLYFEAKIDLLLLLTNTIFKNFDEIISRELSFVSDDPFAQIDNLLTEIIVHMQDSGLSLSFLHTNEILGIMTEQKLDDNFINNLSNKISWYLNEGINKGYFRQLDADLYGKIIFNISHQLFESGALYEYPADVGAISRELSIIIRKILEI